MADLTGTSDHLSDDIDDTELADSLALDAKTDDPKHDVKADVGEQLLAHRATRGLSLEEAAAQSRIAPEHLAAAEDGLESLDEAELERLAEAYGVATTSFFDGRVTPFSYLAGA